MINKKINTALTVLIENGYLTKTQAKKIVFKHAESEMTFLKKQSTPVKETSNTDSKKLTKNDKIFYEHTTFQPSQEMIGKKFPLHTADPDIRNFLASESKKPFTETTNIVLNELYTKKKGVVKSTQKSLLTKLLPSYPSLDDIQIQAELYKGMNRRFVEREKTDLDTRNGVYVYWLTDEGKIYVKKEVL